MAKNVNKNFVKSFGAHNALGISLSSKVQINLFKFTWVIDIFCDF